MLYACTAHSKVLALDPDTGAEIWRFDPQIQSPVGFKGFAHMTCRGVSYLHRRQGARRDRPRGARRVHRLDAVLHFLGPGRQVPAHPHRRGGRRGRHLVVQRRPGDAEEADRREADQGPRGVRLLAGQPGRARRPGGLRRRWRDPRHPAPPAAADDQAGRQAEPVAGRFRRAEGKRRARLHRRLHHHRRDRRRGSGQGVRSQGRRLQQHHGQGARRPPRRSLRRVAARAGAQGVLGLRPRRTPRQRGLDQGAIRRHPPGTGLPGLPRPYRERHSVRTARSAGPVRRQPDRALRDVPGRGGQRLVFRPPAGAVLRGRQDRQGPGGTLQPAQGPGSQRQRALAGAELGYDD